jgi:hypothetical protein
MIQKSFCEDQFVKYHMNIFVMFQYKDGKIRYFKWEHQFANTV